MFSRYEFVKYGWLLVGIFLLSAFMFGGGESIASRYCNSLPQFSTTDDTNACRTLAVGHVFMIIASLLSLGIFAVMQFKLTTLVRFKVLATIAAGVLTFIALILFYCIGANPRYFLNSIGQFLLVSSFLLMMPLITEGERLSEDASLPSTNTPVATNNYHTLLNYQARNAYGWFAVGILLLSGFWFSGGANVKDTDCNGSNSCNGYLAALVINVIAAFISLALFISYAFGLLHPTHTIHRFIETSITILSIVSLLILYCVAEYIIQPVSPTLFFVAGTTLSIMLLTQESSLTGKSLNEPISTPPLVRSSSYKTVDQNDIESQNHNNAIMYNKQQPQQQQASYTQIPHLQTIPLSNQQQTTTTNMPVSSSSSIPNDASAVEIQNQPQQNYSTPASTSTMHTVQSA